MQKQPQKLSAVIVVGQRQDDLYKLVRGYIDALSEIEAGIEVIAVLDGNHPDARESLEKLQSEGCPITIIQLSKVFGEATALMSGFDHSTGDTILTLPAYNQVAPDQLANILESAADKDMVLVRREPRRGSWFERIRRRTFHGLLYAITGYKFNDLGCGVRVISRRVVDEMSLYGDQHRFLPVLATHAGFNVVEVAARQSELDENRQPYKLREYFHRALDIFTIFFLVRFTRKPLRFFGMLGSAVFVVGGLILTILVIERLFFAAPLADRPAMLLSSLLVVLGLQLFSLGLLGELIIFTHAKSMKEYKIDEIIGGTAEVSSTVTHKDHGISGNTPQ
jgi:glycosyltransferase involved in cell wall biosynthesis